MSDTLDELLEQLQGFKATEKARIRRRVPLRYDCSLEELIDRINVLESSRRRDDTRIYNTLFCLIGQIKGLRDAICDIYKHLGSPELIHYGNTEPTFSDTMVRHRGDKRILGVFDTF
jgi:hypothetical protein